MHAAATQNPRAPSWLQLRDWQKCAKNFHPTKKANCAANFACLVCGRRAAPCFPCPVFPSVDLDFFFLFLLFLFFYFFSSFVLPLVVLFSSSSIDTPVYALAPFTHHLQDVWRDCSPHHPRFVAESPSLLLVHTPPCDGNFCCKTAPPCQSRSSRVWTRLLSVCSIKMLLLVMETKQLFP